jgi:2-polyprenyl-3-methyl-5-hydroxy-6-metoxy-1,4-benzoquinol methylase
MDEELKIFFDEAHWYHCIKHENLVSKGIFDLDAVVHNYKFDKDYSEKTVLEIGPSDGYFSLLFKQRGAKLVTAIDSNQYNGEIAIDVSRKAVQSYKNKYKSYKEDFDSFDHIYKRYNLSTSNKLLFLAKLKNLDIEYKYGSIYDLKDIDQYDVVFSGDLLEHLRDPMSGIEQLYTKTKEKCIITVSSALERGARNFFYGGAYVKYVGNQAGGSFYQLSSEAVIAMCYAAGFSRVEVVSRFKLTNKRHNSRNKHFVIHAYV